MNSSLHELQSDIQRLATQQHQIQDLTTQHHLQGLVGQQQQHHVQVCVYVLLFVSLYVCSELAVGWVVWGSISSQGKIFFSSPRHPDLLCDLPSLLIFSVHWELIVQGKAAGTLGWPLIFI